MKFEVGQEVQSKSDPSKIGIVTGLGPIHAGAQYYNVFWGGNAGTKTVSKDDLQIHVVCERPRDSLVSNNLAGYEEFQRVMTFQRLRRNLPLRNNIYAFNASRTRFYPYQFKPLIKFLDSAHHRLLICDEVGLGKTIEAGLILTEIRARQTVQRVLVVCPANLTQKWRDELKLRFGEEFEIYPVSRFLEYLEEYTEKLDRTKINGIISLESIRNKRIIEQLELLNPDFDLVIVDEAHHMRNFGRKQRQAGKLLSQVATAMVMLTATPVQLGLENLYSLLNILDDEDFPDWTTSEERFRQNEPIVEAQLYLGQIPPKLVEARTALERAGNSFWIKNHPLYTEVLSQLSSGSPYSLLNNSENYNTIFRIQQNLAELNLLGHIFTRTRKKEVHENIVQRRAYAVEVSFTEAEQQFYNTVTAFVRAESKKQGDLPFIQQWRLNTPQRRMSSSIPAMVEYYHQHFDITDDDIEDYEDFLLDEEFPDNHNDYNTIREQLRQIVKQWPRHSHDSKYHEFLKALRQSKQEKAGYVKVIVFAFFKGTLTYLAKRLREEGIQTVLVTGDVPADERRRVIDRFKGDEKIEVLLSSRVGSEGLDFQFCDTIFNYDLPWNPMELEQRIGRIDRIGQESQVIHIYNLWVYGTIEERILKRLYDRIEIFKHSIGDIELILGEITQELEKSIFNKALTLEEESKQTERIEKILDNKIEHLQQLETQSAKFIGTDAYFSEEIKAIRSHRRYITRLQLKTFLEDFLKHHAPTARLEYDDTSKTGKLHPDRHLRDFINQQGKTTELSNFLTTKGHIKITFDSQVAFRDPKIEFINVLHPLIIAITDEYSNNQQFQKFNAHHVVLQTKNLPEGSYFFFIFLLQIQSARGRNVIEYVILDENLEEAQDALSSEMIFGEIVEYGETPFGEPIVFDKEFAEAACQAADDVLGQRITSLREEAEQTNDNFIDRRLMSLNTSYQKMLAQKRDLLQRAETEQKPEHYIRMLQGTIRRLENELESKRTELEQKRRIGLEYNEIGAGVLGIVSEDYDSDL